MISRKKIIEFTISRNSIPFSGKIDKEDWNIKNIEDKLVINTQTPDAKKDKVPKWSKAAFQDKFNIMKGKLESSEENQKNERFSAIDAGLAKLQKKLREGSTMETGERGSNRVSALAEELFAKKDTTDDNSNSKSVEQPVPAPVPPASAVRKKSSFGNFELRLFELRTSNIRFSNFESSIFLQTWAA